MYPANHKTVFVLDHTPYFGISSECPLEFDFFKSRGQNLIPLAPVSKSLWTTSVEASLEYCRIVWDLFPAGKLVSTEFNFLVLLSSHHTVLYFLDKICCDRSSGLFAKLMEPIATEFSSCK